MSYKQCDFKRVQDNLTFRCWLGAGHAGGHCSHTGIVIQEPHPSVRIATKFIESIPYKKLSQIQESYASCSADGTDRMAEICGETLNKWKDDQIISDRDLLGLAWSIKCIMDEEGFIHLPYYKAHWKDKISHPPSTD